MSEQPVEFVVASGAATALDLAAFAGALAAVFTVVVASEAACAAVPVADLGDFADF